MSVHAVILAGGTGSRLWPRSTPASPKQFQTMLGERSLLNLAVDRGRAVAADNVWVVTDERYVDTVLDLAPSLARHRVLGEPLARGTLGAVMLAAAAVRAEDAEGILVLLPADHLCADDARLAEAIRLVSANLGPGAIGLVATPTAVVNPAFGHVRPGEVVASNGVADVAVASGYVEKPASEAELDGEPWLRNMGIVIGGVGALLDAAPASVVDAAEQIMRGGEGAIEAWAALGADRIEDAVLPTCPSLLVACVDVEWVDVGTWPALFERADQTPSGNVTDGSVTTISSTGNVIMTTSVPVAAIGVRDLLIVVTPEQVVVCDRDRAEGINKSLGR